MNEVQRLFLIQARSAYEVYLLLLDETTLHHCHALHYLQMATELLGKADAWKQGRSIGKSHKSRTYAVDSFLVVWAIYKATYLAQTYPD